MAVSASMLERLYTAKEVAEALHVPAKSVLHAAERGELKAVRVGRARVRFSFEAVAEWIRPHPASVDGDAA